MEWELVREQDLPPASDASLVPVKSIWSRGHTYSAILISQAVSLVLSANSSFRGAELADFTRKGGRVLSEPVVDSELDSAAGPLSTGAAQASRTWVRKPAGSSTKAELVRVP